MTVTPGCSGHQYGRCIQYARESGSATGVPFESQQQFHNSRSRFKGFSGPIGAGKSQALCYEALKLAYVNPGCPGLIGAPTYPMLRDSTQASFLELVEENDVPYRLAKSANTIYLHEPNSWILFRSLDSFERLRGTNLAWFGVDELTYCKPEAWTRLEGRLRNPQAVHRCGFACWTPKGYDWVYQRFISSEKLPGYEGFLATQNTALPADYYESLKSSYDPRFYQQEALGLYLNVWGGRAYYAFDRQKQQGMVPYSASFPLWWSLDFNVNPMCSLIGQTVIVNHREQIRVLDELVLPDSNTPAACEEFLRRTAKWNSGRPLEVHVYGDATAEHRETSASRTDLQIVRSFFARYPELYQAYFHMPSRNPPVKDRVNCVNAMLLNHAGARRLFIDSRCKELAKDLEQVVWKTDPSGNTLSELNNRDRMRTHLSDALGYYVHRQFPMRAAMGERGGPAIL